MNKNRKISALIFTVLFVIVTAVSAVSLRAVGSETAHGTGIDTSVAAGDYRFTPTLSAPTDIITQEFRLSGGALTAIQIRLANDHSDLVDCTLRFTVTRRGETLWSMDVDSADTENWRYLELPLADTLKKGVTYTLNIQCIEDRAGVPFRVFLCNEDLEESGSLTFNGEAIEGELDLIYEYSLYPVKTLLAVAVLCALGIALAWLPMEKLKKPVFGIIGLLASGFAFFVMVEALAVNPVYRVLPVAIALNTALIAGLALLLAAIFGHSAVGGIIAGVICLVLGIINHYTLLYRGTVVLPSDVFSAATAGQVLNNYNMAPDKLVCLALAGATLIFLLLCKTNHKAGKKGRIALVTLALVLLTPVAAVAVNHSLAVKLNIAISQWDQTSRSKEIGFLLNGVKNIKNLIASKPAGYSTELAEQILAEHPGDDTAASDVQPNIIVIMAEAFSELQDVADFETNTGYLDNFYSLAAEPGCKSGRGVVSIFGGMTSCSEFEFLTGCSLQFLDTAAAPYQQYVRSEIAALPNYLLQSFDYTTSALHPYEPNNWNRKASYPLMGFQEFISSESEEFAQAELVRTWISDRALFDEMLARSEAAEQQIFEFAITMQGHGGYSTPGYENTVELSGVSSEHPEVDQYLSVLKSTDESLAEYLEALRASDEPTIVLLFGDHLPAITSDFYTSCAAERDDSVASQVRQFATPYLFWSNYGVDFSEVPDVISVNFLAPYLLKAAGIPLSNYYQYLYDFSLEYPIVSKNYIFDADGVRRSYDEGDSCYEDLLEYEIIQYYYLFDN